MKPAILSCILAAYAMVLVAAVGRVAADADCRTQITGSPNGTVKFGCPDVACDDGSACTADNTVILVHPEIGKARQIYCRCGDYSPNLKCMGFGYINVVTSVWTYSCMRNGCAVPCTEFNWPPVAAPQTICKC